MKNEGIVLAKLEAMDEKIDLLRIDTANMASMQREHIELIGSHKQCFLDMERRMNEVDKKIDDKIKLSSITMVASASAVIITVLVALVIYFVKPHVDELQKINKDGISHDDKNAEYSGRGGKVSFQTRPEIVRDNRYDNSFSTGDVGIRLQIR